VPVWCP